VANVFVWQHQQYPTNNMYRAVRHIITTIAVVFAGAYTLSAQELRIGAEFTTLFDNTEYAAMDNISSATLFSSRLTPKLGVAWSERNTLMFGVDMVQDFGHDSKFLSDANVQLYYAYKAPRVKVFAGIFPRSEMRGVHSGLFYDPTYLYYNNRIGGVLARYEDDKFYDSYVEFAMDYTGMRDFDTREAFAITSSGHWNITAVYIGYDFYMGHYAKDYNPETRDGVVDNLLITPYLGYKFSANKHYRPIDFDLRVTYMQSLQRDRINENVWQSPCGGELYVNVEWCNISLSNRLLLGGESLLTYYSRYGAEVYHSVPLYRTNKGIYDAITLSYKRGFFSDTVVVAAGITAEYEGTGWGTRQWIELCVDLDYGISLNRKQRYIE